MVAVAVVLEPDDDFAECGVLCVDGTVDGAPHRFILDSGSPSTQVVTSGPPGSSATETASGLFGRVTAELVEVGDLEVPGLASGPRTVQRVVAGPPGLRSLLGLDVLGHHGLALDGPRTTLEVHPTGTLGADRPLRRGPRGHCHLPVLLGDTPALGLWDTGAGITVVSTGLYRSQPELFEPMRSTVGIDAAGVEQPVDIYRIGEYRIGGLVFAGHPVAVVDLPRSPVPFDLALGHPTLRQARWCVDLPAGRWSVSPAPTCIGAES